MPSLWAMSFTFAFLPTKGRMGAQSAAGGRKEYFAGRGPIESRVAAPVNSDWPETGYWLSTNSDARHNSRCPNYRKTRGYPCAAWRHQYR